MNKYSITGTQDLQKVNQYITTFVATHEHAVLPPPFLSQKLTSEIFFTLLKDCNDFSEEEYQHPDLKDFLFLGELLLLFSKKKSSIVPKVTEIRTSYGIDPKQVRAYRKLEKFLKWKQVEKIIEISELEPLLANHSISTKVFFGNPEYGAFCKTDPIFLKYNYIGKFLWWNDNYEIILEKEHFDQAVPL